MSYYGERTSAEVAEEAEVERADLAQTLDKLRENLQSRNVVNEVMSVAKFNSADVSDRISRVARANPIATAIIGVGVAMLLGARRPTRSRPVAVKRDWTDFDRFPSGATPEPRLNPERRVETPGVHRAAPRRGEVRPGTFRTGNAADRFFAGGGTLPSQPAGPVLQRVTRVRRPQSRLERLIDEQPLVLAALGVAVGAAVGSAIPSTDIESQLLGDASHSVRENASVAAKAKFANLKETASQTFEQMKATVADHGATSENLSGLMDDLRDDVRAASHAVADQVTPLAERG